MRVRTKSRPPHPTPPGMIEIPDLDDVAPHPGAATSRALQGGYRYPIATDFVDKVAALDLSDDEEGDTTADTLPQMPAALPAAPLSPLMAHFTQLPPQGTSASASAAGASAGAGADVDITPVELNNLTLSSGPSEVVDTLTVLPRVIEMPELDQELVGVRIPSAPVEFTFGGAGDADSDLLPTTTPLPFHDQRQALVTDYKTPTEYTLHIIFTQFVRIAEIKLSQCADHPLHEDAPVADTLRAGADPAFDKVVALLGFIAKNKPKPVIDLVMFWRKLKLEMAAMAAVDLERVMARQQLILPNPLQPGIAKRLVSSQATLPALTAPLLGLRAKRLLSLMRTKSFPKFGAGGAHRRNQLTLALAITPPLALGDGHHGDDYFTPPVANQQVSHARHQAIVAERKLLALIYILCRVLIEIVRQLTLMGPELRDKLEEIVYSQLKTTDPVATLQLLTRLANWMLFCELLGHMSHDHFVSVSDRFIADLERYGHGELIPVHDEPRLHLLIHGMRFLELRNYPPEDFEETSEFVCLLARFFAALTNETVTFAYCEVIGNMLLPLAHQLTAEVNHPVWMEAMEILYEKASKLWQALLSVADDGGGGAQAWLYLVHLMTAVLACLRRELFSNTWFEMLQRNSFKLRAKVDVEDRITYVVCAARLMWVYLYRLPDTLNNTLKKLDQAVEMLLLQPTKKNGQWLTNDQYLVGALVEFLRVAGYSHLNHMLENVFIPAFNSSFNGNSLEGMCPEKLVVLIRAYLVILEDYEVGQKPKFPLDEVLSQRLKGPFGRPLAATLLPSTTRLPIAEFLFAARTSTNRALHDEICRILANLLRVLDTQYGAHPDPVVLETAPTQASQKFYSHFGLDFSFQQTKELHLEVFVTLLEAVPWALALGAEVVPYKLVVELLTRNVVHENREVAMALMTALQKMALRRNALVVVTHFAKYAFNLSDKPAPYNQAFLTLAQFKRLLKLYVELLNCWVTLFQQTRKPAKKGHPLNQDDERMLQDVLNDLYQVTYSVGDGTTNKPQHQLLPSDELEWKAIITVIEEIEGNGLYFVCLNDNKVRHYGFAILKLVELFDRAMTSADEESNPSAVHLRSSLKFAADAGTRLIHILEKLDLFELVAPLMDELTQPERARIAKLRHKPVARMLIKIAESDYGLDVTLWQRLFAKVVAICFEKCPMPVAICRLVVCTRLVQMHDLVVDYSNQGSDGANKTFSGLFKPVGHAPPELLVEQWKLYLIFACCLLTSTSEQKLSFPTDTPTTTTGGRKKLNSGSSGGVYIQHQTITLAKLVFRMVLPLLKSSQTMVRDAARQGLSCLNINVFRSFLESLPTNATEWSASSTSTNGSNSTAAPAVPARDVAGDRARVEIVHILAVVMSRFVDEAVIFDDEWIVANLVSLVKSVKTFLLRLEVQTAWEYQRLRRFWCQFLHPVLQGLQKHRSDIDRWMPFEARIGCFRWLTEWCGYGLNKDIEFERYLAMYKAIGHPNHRDAAQVAAKLEVERMALQAAALEAMATIVALPTVCDVPVGEHTITMLFDIPNTMAWIKLLMVYHENDDRRWLKVGERAFANIVSSLLAQCRPMSDEIIKELFSSDVAQLTEVYFTGYVREFVKHDPKLFGDDLTHQVMCLATFLVGHHQQLVRSVALEVMAFLEPHIVPDRAPDQLRIALFRELVMLQLKVVYKKALFDILTHLALADSQGTLPRILYMTKYFSVVLALGRRDLLACLLPWMLAVILAYDETEPVGDVLKPLTQGRLNTGLLMVLNNLFEITLLFADTISNEVEALWVALGLTHGNFDKILDFILSLCLERKHPEFVVHLKQIVDYLAFNNSQNQQDFYYIVDKFLDNLHPRLMVPPQPKRFTTDVIDPHNFLYVADVSLLIPYNDKDPLFSLGQLSLTFMVDLFTIGLPQFADKVAMLVHVLIVLLDHYLPLIQDQALEMLIHLLHHLDPQGEHAELVEETSDMLRQGRLWAYDDLNNDDVKRGARTPIPMDRLVRNVLKVVPHLQVQWLRVALHWATTCAVRHIACRLFQVFRLLLLFLDQLMLRDMLHRLLNTIADDTDDIQGFAMQILMTLNAIVAELSLEKLIDFPQLFWLAVACLYTVHEPEYIELLLTMAKFVLKIDLAAPDTILCLILTFPPKWEGRFAGLHQVILAGTRLGRLWDSTIKLMDKLLVLPDSEVIGVGSHRLLMAFLPNIPRFLHALLLHKIPSDVATCALNLAALATAHNRPHVARILVLISKNRFRLKDDFIVLCVHTLEREFFPQYEAQLVVLLMGMLANLIDWVKLETLAFLRHLLPVVNLSKPEYSGVGADLISPLLRLLLTEHAESALRVLDEVEHILGSQLDREVLRMALGTTGAAARESQDNVTALFGIPQELGWSVPTPSLAAANTRNNVHAVYLTCTPTVVEEDGLDDDTIEFHRELPGQTPAYSPQEADADEVSMAVTDDHEALLLNVWAALDDLDSFFTKEQPEAGMALPALELVPQVYENDVLFILNRLLARTQLNILFRTGLADTPMVNLPPPALPQMGYHSLAIAPRRLYIPFRLKRADTTPRIDNHQFEATTPTTLSPYANGNSNSVSTIITEGNLPTENPPPHHSPLNLHHLPLTRFEGILGGSSRKRLRKSLVLPPVLVVQLPENPTVATANILNQPISSPVHNRPKR